MKPPRSGASASGSGFAPLGTALVGYRLHPVGRAGFQFRVGGMAMMGKGLSLSASDPAALGVFALVVPERWRWLLSQKTDLDGRRPLRTRT